jgi:hypothetical protein
MPATNAAISVISPCIAASMQGIGGVASGAVYGHRIPPRCGWFRQLDSHQHFTIECRASYSRHWLYINCVEDEEASYF